MSATTPPDISPTIEPITPALVKGRCNWSASPLWHLGVNLNSFIFHGWRVDDAVQYLNSTIDRDAPAPRLPGVNPNSPFFYGWRAADAIWYLCSICDQEASPVYYRGINLNVSNFHGWSREAATRKIELERVERVKRRAAWKRTAYYRRAQYNRTLRLTWRELIKEIADLSVEAFEGDQKDRVLLCFTQRVLREQIRALESELAQYKAAYGVFMDNSQEA